MLDQETRQAIIQSLRSAPPGSIRERMCRNQLQAAGMSVQDIELLLAE